MRNVYCPEHPWMYNSNVPGRMGLKTRSKPWFKWSVLILVFHLCSFWRKIAFSLVILTKTQWFATKCNFNKERSLLFTNQDVLWTFNSAINWLGSWYFIFLHVLNFYLRKKWLMHLLYDLDSPSQFLLNHIYENCIKAFLKLEKKIIG